MISEQPKRELQIDRVEAPEAQKGAKKPHFISSRLLEALGGIKEQTVAEALVDRGAYLWGVEDREKGAGIFRHVLLASRVAYNIAKELKKRDIPEYKNIDLQSVVEAALLHDIAKLYGEDREKLSVELKEALGLKADFKEISNETNEVGTSWLKDLGFSPAVYEAIREHGFPEEIPDNPYSKIILLADFMAGQKIMPVEERLADVKTRWIDQRIAQKQSPRIEPELFDKAQKVIREVAQEIFQFLGTGDNKFIEDFELNSDESMQRWEGFLTKTRMKKSEGRAKNHVRGLFKDFN